MSPFRPTVVFALAVASALAQSPETVRKEIEASYARALNALQHAKSMEDLAEINRSIDTLDWKSFVPGEQPRRWADLRKYGFEALWPPFQAAALHIDAFEVTGDTVA